MLHDYNVECFQDIIVDVPYETEDTCKETLDLLLEMKRPFKLNMLSLIHLPGTELTRRLLADGLIEEQDIEGAADKGLALRLSFSNPRAPYRQFYYALFSLSPKSLVPKALIRWLSGSETLKKHPAPVVVFAGIMNAIKNSFWVFRLLLTGQMDRFRIARAWRSRRTFIG